VRRLMLVVGMAGGCAPPPAVEGLSDGEPTIRIVYPPDGTEDIRLGLDRRLEVLVVVDFEDFHFVPAYDKSEPVEGEGHWHLQVGDADVVPAEDLYVEFVSEPGAFDVGELVLVTASLVGNNHQPVEGAQDATIEFRVGGGL